MSCPSSVASLAAWWWLGVGVSLTTAARNLSTSWSCQQLFPILLQATVYWTSSTSSVPTCHCYTAAHSLSPFLLLWIWDTLHMLVLLCVIEAMGHFVCISANNVWSSGTSPNSLWHFLYIHINFGCLGYIPTTCFVTFSKQQMRSLRLFCQPCIRIVLQVERFAKFLSVFYMQKGEQLQCIRVVYTAQMYSIRLFI